MPPGYAELRRQALAAVERGDLEASITLWEQTVSCAREAGRQDLVDLATVNVWIDRVEVGRGDGALEALRPLLLRLTDPLPKMLAAYTVARFLELRKDWKKALFYSRCAAQHAERLTPAYRAGCANQLGNLLLAESKVPEATARYEEALALVPPADELLRARGLENLGYCRALAGRFDEAFAHLHESLRILRQRGATRYQVTARIALAFAHLEVGKWRWASYHAQRAIAMARDVGDREELRKAIYLAASAERDGGRLERARELFLGLEDEFGDGHQLTSLMLQLDLRQVVNLRS